MLHLRDLLGNEGRGERLRHFLRCSRLQIEESGVARCHGRRVSPQPEGRGCAGQDRADGPVDDAFLRPAGGRPRVARRFRVKVDFAEASGATPQTRQTTATFIAHTGKQRGLPDFLPQRWRACSSKPIARPTTNAARAPRLPAGDRRSWRLRAHAVPPARSGTWSRPPTSTPPCRPAPCAINYPGAAPARNHHRWRAPAVPASACMWARSTP